MFALAIWSVVGALVASRALSVIRAPSRVLILQGGAWMGLGHSGDEASLDSPWACTFDDSDQEEDRAAVSEYGKRRPPDVCVHERACV